MNRDLMIAQMNGRKKPFDFVIIGGGATGAGIALEAASRGYSAILLEKYDFAKSTSGKSTKLVHGGVRYLAQGNLVLVREACVERGRLLNNAPHLVKNQSFIIPAFGLTDEVLYTLGLTFYDLLAGRYSLGRSMRIPKNEVLRRIPALSGTSLTAGILYHDGQFDDTRLTLNVMQTAAGLGATVLNYMSVMALLKNRQGQVCGVNVRDTLTGNTAEVAGRVVINATGVFADEIMQMDDPLKEHTIRPSQGIHLVIEKEFIGGDDAVMIPKTDDGRVLFAVPWHGKVVLGTTDTPVDNPSPEPVALDHEIDFILDTAGKYLLRAPGRGDVLSVFAGLRPLAATGGDNGKKTREISRSHKIIVSSSGLMTMIGGKWTTFRKMAEDMINKAERVQRLGRTYSVTKGMKIRGYHDSVDLNDPMYIYGSDKNAIDDMVRHDGRLGEYISETLRIIKAQILWAVREEMAVTIEDVLSRRTRCQLLDARESIRMAPEVGRLMAGEMNKGSDWVREQVKNYSEVTGNYFLR